MSEASRLGRSQSIQSLGDHIIVNIENEVNEVVNEVVSTEDLHDL